MRTLATLLRGCGLLALALSLTGSPSVSAQGDTTPATLTIVSRNCPDGLTNENFHETCQGDPIPDTFFSLIGPLTDVERVIDGQLNTLDGGRTDASGQLVFEIAAPGDYEVVGGLRVDFGVVGSWCYQSSDRTATVDTETAGTDQSELSAPGPGYFSTFVSLGSGDAITCDVFAQNGIPEMTATTAAPEETTPAEPSGSAEEQLTAETDGSTAAIYAGDCDGDFTDEPVATLTNVRPPAGDTAGAETSSAVETSFTTLDLPLDDILAEDHVLIVFDEDDDSVALACGSIGGIVAEDGSLAFGLAAIGESRYSGVAILTEDGEQTLATVFIAENLHPDADETPAA